MRAFVSMLFLMCIAHTFAQEREVMQGKIVSRSRNLEGVYVSNINTGEATLSSKGGYFEVEAKINDTLMFSGALFIGYRRVLDEIDFQRDIMLVPMEENELVTQQLDEILITKITSASLGIVPPDIKKYTPAERRLYTANSGSGLIPIDMIVNAITGRTKMLKKALQYEKQEMRKDDLLDVVSSERLQADFGIPEAYVVGFAYYAVTNENLISLLNNKQANREQYDLVLGELALKFLDMIQEKQNSRRQYGE